MSNAVKYKKAKKQPSTHCRVCGTINISKYVSNFLRTNPTTLILSSFFFFFFFFFLEGGGGHRAPSFAPNFN